MTDDRHERIRQRAHEIWEQSGRPDGAHMEHWEKATAEVDAAGKPKAKKAAVGKPKATKSEMPAKAKAAKPKAKS